MRISRSLSAQRALNGAKFIERFAPLALSACFNLLLGGGGSTKAISGRKSEFSMYMNMHISRSLSALLAFSGPLSPQK